MKQPSYSGKIQSVLLITLVSLSLFCMGQPNIVNEKTAFKVETKRIGNCTQSMPVGWQSSTTKEGNAIDLFDEAHSMYAGYLIVPVNTNMWMYDRELYNKDPERSVLRICSILCGTMFGEKAGLNFTDEINEQFDGYLLRSVTGSECKGVVLYKVLPGDRINFTYIEAIRCAFTKKDLWEQKGELVTGVATSILCTTIYVPHDMPSLPKRSSLQPSSSSSSKGKKDDYGYNVQLGTEYCHNPRTGENFRVSRSNWSDTGPDGPGYYGMAGNERIKMAAGRSD